MFFQSQGCQGQRRDDHKRDRFLTVTRTPSNSTNAYQSWCGPPFTTTRTPSGTDSPSHVDRPLVIAIYSIKSDSRVYVTRADTAQPLRESWGCPDPACGGSHLLASTVTARTYIRAPWSSGRSASTDRVIRSRHRSLLRRRFYPVFARRQHPDCFYVLSGRQRTLPVRRGPSDDTSIRSQYPMRSFSKIRAAPSKPISPLFTRSHNSSIFGSVPASR